MDIPNIMISDTIKKLAGYNYYIAKKKESAKDKIVDEPEEQRVSPAKSRRGKGFMCYGGQVVNVPKKDVMTKKTRSLTIAEDAVVGEHANSISIQESRTQRRRRSQLTINSQIDDALVDTYAEWGQNLKGEGSSNAHNKHYADSDTNSDAILYSLCLEQSENETDDADNSDMDLFDDNLDGDDDTT
ncbi:hypothetical protein Tco_0120703 [Tanacetum coccineum]